MLAEQTGEQLAVLLVEDVPVQMMAPAGAMRDAGLRVVEAPTVEAVTPALSADL